MSSRIRCIKPKIRNGSTTRCGTCHGCRLRHKMAWTGRLLIESLCHEESRVVTLTYANPDDQLSPLNYDHIQTFLDNRRERLRYRNPDHQMRYFVVGEYGEETGHAHWHIALFGEQSCQPPGWEKAVYISLKGWTDQHGFASDMRLNPRTSAYICGYTLKKGENQKPFMQPSRRPGIGFPWIYRFCEEIYSRYGSRPIPSPTWLNIAGKKYPLNDGLLRYFERTYIRLGGLLHQKPSPQERRQAAYEYSLTTEYLNAHGAKALAIMEGERIGPQRKRPNSI